MCLSIPPGCLQVFLFGLWSVRRGKTELYTTTIEPGAFEHSKNT